MDDITWQIGYLQSGTCAISHPPDPIVLATTWGDSSGTGTSSTFRLVYSFETSSSDEDGGWECGLKLNTTPLPTGKNYRP
eukprot:8131206-Ditylum_brightwellii.AAC.1